jgi:hypothetical protein
MSITKVVSPFLELAPHTDATDGGSTFTGVSSAPPVDVNVLDVADVEDGAGFCVEGGGVAGFIVTPLEDGARPP